MFWIIFLLWPQATSAHVHWFVQDSHLMITPYQWFEPIVWLSGLGAAIFLAILAWFTPRDYAIWNKINPLASQQRNIVMTAYVLALVFSVVAVHAELALVYVGLVLYGLLIWRYPQIAVRLLMIGVGLSFTQAAFAEKLLHPELSAEFLLSHHWNFLYNLGFTWYTDRIFILQAGLVEALLGLALALGFAPRLVIALLSLVCVITASILGVAEVMGHVAIVLSFVMILCSQLQPVTKQLTYTN